MGFSTESNGLVCRTSSRRLRQACRQSSSVQVIGSGLITGMDVELPGSRSRVGGKIMFCTKAHAMLVNSISKETQILRPVFIDEYTLCCTSVVDQACSYCGNSAHKRTRISWRSETSSGYS